MTYSKPAFDRCPVMAETCSRNAYYRAERPARNPCL